MIEFGKLKHYWIFLITIIFYSIGIAIHFIAQHGGTRPHKGRDILEKVKPVTSTITEAKKYTNDKVNSETDNIKYTKPDNLFYFIQVSDIHISQRYSKGAQGNFFYLLKKMIPIIDPNFLFVTGDITDSQKGTTIGTVEEDWEMYRKIIESTGVADKNNGTFLWDLRGNHDCFLVPEWNSPYNYFKDYSRVKTRGFGFNYETSYGTYSFVGLDGCPLYSTTNPFFGIIDEVSMDMYTSFMDKAKTSLNNKHNFVLLHYPETTLKFGKSSSGKRWEDYTKDISLLLSGHLHNLGGSRSYAYHHDFLELEIIDFKFHGRYRIVSVDNDIVSFNDFDLPLPKNPYNFRTSDIDKLINNPPEVFDQPIPPIVHITSPKNSRFILKRPEPIKESLDSNYIRVLIFSEQSPSDLVLSLFIDNKVQNVEFKYVGNRKLEKRSLPKINIYSREENLNDFFTTLNKDSNVKFNTPPLWIAKWNSSKYDDNQSHELKVVVQDSRNLRGENTIKFRLDGKSDSLNVSFRGKLILKSVFIKTLPIIFGIVYIIYELMILLPRLYAVKYIIPEHDNLPYLPNIYISDIISDQTKSFQSGSFSKHFILPFIEAFTYNGVFYPLQILMICLLVLPAKIGEVTRSSDNISKIGGEFLYGLYGSGQWASIVDLYGIDLVFFILVTFVDTLIIVFSNHKQNRNRIITLIILFFMFLIQISGSFAISYVCGGVMSLFFSPFPTWNCLYCWFLIFIIVLRRFRSNEKPVTPEMSAIKV